MTEEEEERAPQLEAPDVDQSIIEETERLEQLAMNLSNAIPVRSLPKQEYLQATVIPILLEGMSWIIKERPSDPVESLAMFLIKNNPNTPEMHKTLDLTEIE